LLNHDYVHVESSPLHISHNTTPQHSSPAASSHHTSHHTSPVATPSHVSTQSPYAGFLPPESPSYVPVLGSPSSSSSGSSSRTPVNPHV
jgi:hypothetical protein